MRLDNLKTQTPQGSAFFYFASEMRSHVFKITKFLTASRLFFHFASFCNGDETSDIFLNHSTSYNFWCVSMDPNDWSPIELFNIGICLSVLLFSVLFSTWQAFRSKTKGWLWRLYSGVIWIGLVIMLYSDKFPEATTHKMPAEFVAGTWLLMTGIAATMIHSLLILIPYVRQRRPLSMSSADSH